MKTKKRNRTTEATWTGADHADRDEARRHKSTSGQQQRREALSHDTVQKREVMRLKLHLTKAQREVDDMKKRLEVWDDKEEREKEKERQRKLNEPAPVKKKGRLGPETWKLKGAARPAWQVYDFDTRYVDPHIEAHKRAKEKATRVRNILVVYRGRFAKDAPDAARDYLGALMQLGHLSMEAKKYKTARSAWLECIELEGDDPITTARESLMRMYLDLKRFDAALRLGERLADDKSVWIRYSLAVLAFQEKMPEAEQYMVRAIQANPFCAYYLGFYDTFNGVMEYTEELEEAEDEPQSTLEEAIEYCCSNQAAMWLDSKANVTLKNILVRAAQGNHSDLKQSDLDWSERLTRIVHESEKRAAEDAADQAQDEDSQDGEREQEEGEDESEQPAADADASDSNEQDACDGEDAAEEDGSEGSNAEEEGDESESEGEKVDVFMFAGMFRTAMEMLQQSGQLGVLQPE